MAVKILPAERGSDPDRLRRFESEARAIAALDHPHILALHDVGSEGGLSYVVLELLEGQTLRQRLEQGDLPLRKCVEWGVQACKGLAAAHARGIVHRDLKPENMGLTSDGRIKILDFGLAKLTEPLQGLGEDRAETRTATDSGLVVGTVGYMSPEQVRGRSADARSDIFSLGAVLYEMLTGRRAFQGSTPADTISAILHLDPPDMATAPRTVPVGLDRVVRRCLDKEPDERFQTARDLAFALEHQWGVSSSGVPTSPPARSQTRWLGMGAAVLVLAAALGGGFIWGSSRTPLLPDFKQLTFRRGMILDARFTPDGNTVIYSGLFDGNAAETYSRRLDRPEALRLDLPPAQILGFSSSGELALKLARRAERQFSWNGTLARVPLSGGAPRALLDDVWWADWSPNGEDLAVIRTVNGHSQLEYPVGRVLLRPVTFSDGGFSMRVSPRGDKVAFTSTDGSRSVTVIDRAGTVKSLATAPYGGVGLAWDPSGDAIWVAAGGGYQATGLWRLGLDGTSREAARLPGPVMIHDMARDGRLLVHLGFERGGIRAQAPGDSAERELCPMSQCDGHVLSADGRQLLLRDTSEQGSDAITDWLFLVPTQGGPAVRLGNGYPVALSPDGEWVVVVTEGEPHLNLIPTRSGAPKTLNTAGLGGLFPAWFLDTSHVLVFASGPDQHQRTYKIDIEGGEPVPVLPENIVAVPDSLNNRSVLGVTPGDGKLAWYPLGGGEPRPISALRPPDTLPLGVSRDGRFLFVGEKGVPGRIDRIDLETGRRLPWKSLLPEDSAGVVMVAKFSVAADGNGYAYNYWRYFQDLYLVEGVR